MTIIPEKKVLLSDVTMNVARFMKFLKVLQDLHKLLQIMESVWSFNVCILKTYSASQKSLNLTREYALIAR